MATGWPCVSAVVLLALGGGLRCLSIFALAAKATSIGARPHHRISVSGYVVSASPVHKHRVTKLWESGRLIRMPSVRPSFPMDCFASRLRVPTSHPSIYQCDRAEIKISRFWSFASIAPIINGGGKGYTAKPKVCSPHKRWNEGLLYRFMNY